MDTAHVLVAGGGMGGLTATVSALQSGAKVTLIEKSDRLGGSAAMSHGMLTTYRDFDRFRASAPGGDELLQHMVHETFPSASKWLDSLGVELRRVEGVLDRYDGWEISPHQFVSRAQAAITALGGTVHLGVALDELCTADGAVTGAKLALDSGRTQTLKADAVVLATGGFQGSPELLARYALLDANCLAHRSNPWSTGDGLSAALAAGAGTSAGLGGFYGHTQAAPPARRTADKFAELSQYYGSRAVALDMTGRRFTDETVGAFDENVNEALACRPSGLGFYVFDDKFARSAMTTGVPVPEVAARRVTEAGGVVVRADTLRDLTNHLTSYGVPAEVAFHSLEQFARVLHAGKPSLLDVPRTGEGTELQHGPFTAVWVQAGITFTTGGIAVDEDLRVLRRSRSTAPMSTQWISDARDHRIEVIPGLFAVGADIGGVSCGGYAGGLATALATGRRAGTNAAIQRR